jgi:hypothetical protein
LEEGDSFLGELEGGVLGGLLPSFLERLVLTIGSIEIMAEREGKAHRHWLLVPTQTGEITKPGRFKFEDVSHFETSSTALYWVLFLGVSLFFSRR